MKRESFLLYNSFYEPIKTLNNEQLGKLFRAIFDYTIDGKITNDNEIFVAFMFIKNQLEIDGKKWEEEKTKRSNAGKKGMEKRWHNKDNNVINVNNKNKSVINDITKITDNVNVNENVYVNDNVNINNINNKNNINIINKENNKKKYFENDELNNVFLEFLDLRKKIKAVNSERAINMLLKKLSNYDDETKKKMIERSILNSWKDVYEIKKEEIKKYSEEWWDKI